MEKVMKKMENLFGFGSVEFEGEKYIFTQDVGSILPTGLYESVAMKVGDKPDDDGYVPLYTVKRKIVNQTEAEEDEYGLLLPVAVDVYGAKYNLNDGSVYIIPYWEQQEEEG